MIKTSTFLHAIFLAALVCGVFCSEASATRIRGRLKDNQPIITPPGVISVSVDTIDERLARPRNPVPSTCDRPVPAPADPHVAGDFEYHDFSVVPTRTGCVTVRFRGGTDKGYQVAAYTSFNLFDPRQHLMGQSQNSVEQYGETQFFSFMATAGSSYHLVVWHTLSADVRIPYDIELNEPQSSPSDFDGDGFTDSAVFRPSTGAWYILRSSDNTVAVDFFGSNGDVPLDGDFDGDGKTDLGIFRPSNGTWYYKRSSNGTFFGAFFGLGTDKPVPGDYDKDGITDIGAFRDGNWLLSPSGGAAPSHTTVTGYQFGSPGDIPVGSQRK